MTSIHVPMLHTTLTTIINTFHSGENNSHTFKYNHNLKLLYILSLSKTGHNSRNTELRGLPIYDTFQNR